MKYVFRMIMATVAVITVASCSSGNDDLSDFLNDSGNNGGFPPGSTTSDSGATSLGELTSFDIVVDQTALNETESVPSDDEDYLENNTFGTTIQIAYNGSTASVEGSADGVTVTTDGANVTVNSTVKGINYVLSGSTGDGMFKIYSEKKFQLTLNGVSINNNDGPAINSQSGKRAYVVLADGTTNALSDGSSYAAVDGEDQKATLFSEGELLFSGSGALNISANTKAGIASDDYILFRPGNNIYVKSTAGNGIKANDAILIKGGVINVETSATAAKALSSDGFVTISGGRTTLLTTGGGKYDSDEKDTKGSSGLKADSTFTMNGGTLLCKSTGKGGKGISSDGQIIINDGTVKVITTGEAYTYGSQDTKAKGIKADGNLSINGGSVMVRATGGEGSEGIESKNVMTITGGTTEVYSYDDGLNSASHMYIQGGYIFSYATNNDGIDSNGNMYIQGGTTVAYGTSAPECGIDANEEDGYRVIVSGGTLVALGGGTSYPSAESTQPSIVYGGTATSGTTFTLNSSSAAILSLTLLRSYNGSATFFFTSPSLKSGSSFAVYSGATASGTDWYGLKLSPTVDASGSSVATISQLASPYSQAGSSSNGMGGPGNPGARR
ncbi:MAG: carbohydrate-binding domain-containing protein [Prevotella sp.]|nr:carbohydrate-binding domain-containing protein [Prevotella sp.]